MDAYEESLKGWRRDKEEEEHLLLTRAEWEAKAAEKKRSCEGSNSSTKKNGGSGRGRGQDGDKKKHRIKFNKSNISCFNCQEFGHFASECDEPKKKRVYLTKPKRMTSQLS